MYFDGETKIVTPLVRFAPCTIEAWVRPSTDDATSAFIGCDSAGEYGLGLEYIKAGFTLNYLATPLIPLCPYALIDGLISLLATMQTRTRLYVDGRLVSREMPTMMFGETAFGYWCIVTCGHSISNAGHIRSVRISKGVRYQGDFTPTEDLLADGDSQLTYDLKHWMERKSET